MALALPVHRKLSLSTRRRPATTDASVASIQSRGWVVTTSSPPADFVGRSVVVLRPGFDATAAAVTRAVSVPLRGRLRNAITQAGAITLTDADVYLTDYILAEDTVVGGPVANASAETSPLPIAQFYSTDRRLVSDSVTIEVNAQHWSGIACVAVTATDQHGHSVTVKCSEQVVAHGTYDFASACISCYKATLDLSSLTDGDLITINARVYPWHGGAAAVLDSSTGTASNRGFVPQIYKRDTHRYATPVIAYVDATSGVDGTGVVSIADATAAAAPFATYAAAVQALQLSTTDGKTAGTLDGCIVRLKAGTHALAASLTAFTDNSVTALQVRPAAGETASTVTLQTTAASSPAMRVKYWSAVGVTLKRASAASFCTPLSGGKYYLFGSTVDNAALGTTFFNGGLVHLVGNTLIGGSAQAWQASAQMKIGLARANTYGVMGTAFNFDCFNICGNYFKSVAVHNNANDASGTMIYANRLMGVVAQGVNISALVAGQACTYTGFVMIGNVVEYISTTNAPAIRLSGDGEFISFTHVILAHNTVAGYYNYGRCNLFYDENKQTSTLIRRTHKFIVNYCNIWCQWNEKTDRYAWTLIPTDAPNRIGAWAPTFGVASGHNFCSFVNDAGGQIVFGPEDPGVGSVLPPVLALDPQFMAPACTTGPTITAGAGDGDYRLRSTSPARFGFCTRKFQAFDLVGNARNDNGAAGAYEYAA